MIIVITLIGFILKCIEKSSGKYRVPFIFPLTHTLLPPWFLLLLTSCISLLHLLQWVSQYLHITID